MSRVMSVRVSEECAAWAAGCAEGAGVKRQVVLENAIERFRELWEAEGPQVLRSFRDEESAAEVPVEPAPVEDIRVVAARAAARAKAERERKLAGRGW
jgi:hypothetical protein